jgi:hypothetical protein
VLRGSERGSYFGVAVVLDAVAVGASGVSQHDGNTRCLCCRGLVAASAACTERDCGKSGSGALAACVTRPAARKRKLLSSASTFPSPNANVMLASTICKELLSLARTCESSSRLALCRTSTVKCRVSTRGIGVFGLWPLPAGTVSDSRSPPAKRLWLWLAFAQSGFGTVRVRQACVAVDPPVRARCATRSRVC